jgi:predicted nucleic acid-binding Zn ribbon protein
MFVCSGCGKLIDDDSQAILFDGLFFCSDECLEIYRNIQKKKYINIKILYIFMVCVVCGKDTRFEKDAFCDDCENLVDILCFGSRVRKRALLGLFKKLGIEGVDIDRKTRKQ